VQRLRQARAVLLRAQLALTGAQFLFWVALIGVVLTTALWVLRRRSGGKSAGSGEASAIGSGPGGNAGTVASATSRTRFPGSNDREEDLKTPNSQEGNANG
jgi:LPXTG-motif cell wall-anchored protein